jgi:glycerophosphoryl diester phosphodiesterase
VSYQIAISAGANGGECDVRSSADGVLLLAHDGSPKRTMGGGKEDLAKMTYAEIQKLDAGSWKGKQFKGEKVPTFDEYLDLLQGTACHPVIEIKADGIEQQVLESVRQKNMLNAVVIIAFSPKVVQNIRRLEPNVCAAWLYSEKLQGSAEDNADRLKDFFIAKSKELDTAVFDVQDVLLSAELVQSLQRAGLRVWCWTVNDVERMNTLLDWGVESITTDRPELLNELIKKRNKEGKVQKLP